MEVIVLPGHNIDVGYLYITDVSLAMAVPQINSTIFSEEDIKSDTLFCG